MSSPERWVSIPAEDVLVVYGDQERPDPSKWVEVPLSLVRLVHTAEGDSCAVSCDLLRRLQAAA